MKLAQIPKQPEGQHSAEEAVPQVDESVEGITSPDESIMVYGLHPSDPDYPAEVERLRALKRRDPALYKKMQSLD